MYIETSAPRRPGDKARLISPPINGKYAQCVSFYYHMYGPHVKSLNVYLTSGNSTVGSPAWTRQGTQANAWVMGQLQIAGGSLTQGITNVSTILGNLCNLDTVNHLYFTRLYFNVDTMIYLLTRHITFANHYLLLKSSICKSFFARTKFSQMTCLTKLRMNNVPVNKT